jgi:hypothetical protein
MGQAVVGRDKGAASLKALPKEKGGLSSTKMKRNKNAEYAEGAKKKRGSSVWIVMDSALRSGEVVGSEDGMMGQAVMDVVNSRRSCCCCDSERGRLGRSTTGATMHHCGQGVA